MYGPTLIHFADWAGPIRRIRPKSGGSRGRGSVKTCSDSMTTVRRRPGTEGSCLHDPLNPLPSPIGHSRALNHCRWPHFTSQR
ncbi:hypothetical protein EVAR_86814_1 [Eumeta japonica]|uniref:Uncharacterized protein n=1 Tax=Eumeta variegata TaxID=151549 RepID=A0A4C1VVB8_EUMVA|nr:hypothetical protein EVAR_86814_1 [Eumeta japonica]